jgi:hypothetical protein
MQLVSYFSDFCLNCYEYLNLALIIHLRIIFKSKNLNLDSNKYLDDQCGVMKL